MKTIKAGYEILTPITGDELIMIEIAGRTCYKSKDHQELVKLFTLSEDLDPEGKREARESAKKFVKMLIDRKHEAMLEHSSLTIKFICDHGVSHELVRHRLASFGQESTRYCNYAGDKFGNELTFIEPLFFFERVEREMTNKEYNDYILKQKAWENAMMMAEKEYMFLIEHGATPQEARSVLPNSIKTEVVMTANYREWRHFFKLRAARETGPAHPQMEEITKPLLKELHERIPIVFDDIYYQMDVILNPCCCRLEEE